MASTMCLGSALSECSEAVTNTGDDQASHQGGLWAGGPWGDELCSGAVESERAECPVEMLFSLN